MHIKAENQNRLILLSFNAMEIIKNIRANIKSKIEINILSFEITTVLEKTEKIKNRKQKKHSGRPKNSCIIPFLSANKPNFI